MRLNRKTRRRVAHSRRSYPQLMDQLGILHKHWTELYFRVQGATDRLPVQQLGQNIPAQLKVGEMLADIKDALAWGLLNEKGKTSHRARLELATKVNNLQERHDVFIKEVLEAQKRGARA